METIYVDYKNATTGKWLTEICLTWKSHIEFLDFCKKTGVEHSGGYSSWSQADHDRFGKGIVKPHYPFR